MAVGVNTRIVWYILNFPVHNKVVYGKPSDSHLLFCQSMHMYCYKCT